MSSYTVELVIPEDCEIECTGRDESGEETTTVSGETLEVAVGEEEYVLAAARAAGVWLPADCQQGWCTTCAADLLSGEVDQSDAKRYYDEDRDADLILPCTAKPRSDLRLQVCQHEAMLDHRAAHDLPPGRSKR